MDMWTLSAAVMVFALGSATTDHVFTCDNLCVDSCDCTTFTSTTLALRCPQLSVEFYIGSNDTLLKCTNSSSINYTSLSGLHIGDIESFTLSECPLPDISLKELMSRIGINKIKFLDIRSFSILDNDLKKRHFEKLNDVTGLSLNAISLTYLPSNLFEGIINLTSLYLKCDLIEIPEEIFYFTPKLQLLDLSMNNLTNLNPGIFRNLSNLSLLSVWGNRLKNLTRSVFSDIPNLEILNLSKNHMETVRPNLFDDLIKLKKLLLSDNRFTSLPQGIFSRNERLEQFQMIGNNRIISSLPTELFSNLTMLTEISMRGSMIMALSENIFSGSKNILTIDLSCNSLSTLPEETFTDLECLENLDLSVNSIERIPEKLFHHNLKLKTLNLGHNNVKEIPTELFLQLEKIEHLDLSFNKIKSITGKQFYGLKSLKMLDISNNELTSLALENHSFKLGDYSVFQKNTNLVYLLLSNNSLTEIYLDWRLVLKSLRTLDLSYNQFRFLTADDFNLIGNKYVDLSNNNISTVDYWRTFPVAEDSYTVFRNLHDRYRQRRSKRFNLANNPFHCDCKMLLFIQYLRGELPPETLHDMYQIPTEDLKCSEPKELKKMSLSNVPFNMLKCQFTNNTEPYACPEECTCHFRPIDKANIINCENVGLKQIPASLPTSKNVNHTELYLARNKLREITIPTNKGYESVTHLGLGYNDIYNIRISEISKQLKKLDLSNNKLTSMTSEDINTLKMATDLESLELTGNPWRCECQDKKFIRTLKYMVYEIKHFDNITCSDGRLLVELNESELCPESTHSYTLILSEVCAVLALLYALLTIFFYRFREKINIYCCSRDWKLFSWKTSQPGVDESCSFTDNELVVLP